MTKSKPRHLCSVNRPVMTITTIIFTLIIIIIILSSSSSSSSSSSHFFVSAQDTTITNCASSSTSSLIRDGDRYSDALILDGSTDCDIEISNVEASQIILRGTHENSSITIRNLTCYNNLVLGCIFFDATITNSRNITVEKVHVLEFPTAGTEAIGVLLHRTIRFGENSGISISEVELSNARCFTMTTRPEDRCNYFGILLEDTEIRGIDFLHISNITLRNLTLYQQDPLVAAVFFFSRNEPPTVSFLGNANNPNCSFEIHDISVSDIVIQSFESVREVGLLSGIESMASIADFSRISIYNIVIINTSTMSMSSFVQTIPVRFKSSVISASTTTAQELRTFNISNISVISAHLTSRNNNGVIMGCAVGEINDFFFLTFSGFEIRNFFVEAQRAETTGVAPSSSLTGCCGRSSTRIPAKLLIENVLIENGTFKELENSGVVYGVFIRGPVTNFHGISILGVGIRDMSIKVTNGHSYCCGIRYGRLSTTRADPFPLEVQDTLIENLAIEAADEIRVEGMNPRDGSGFDEFGSYKFSRMTIRNLMLVAATGDIRVRAAFILNITADAATGVVADARDFTLDNITATTQTAGTTVLVHGIEFEECQNMQSDFWDFSLSKLDVIAPEGNISVMGVKYNTAVKPKTRSRDYIASRLNIEDVALRGGDSIDVSCLRAVSLSPLLTTILRESSIRNVDISSSSSRQQRQTSSTKITVHVFHVDDKLTSTRQLNVFGPSGTLGVRSVFADHIPGSISISCLFIGGELELFENSGLDQRRNSIRDAYITRITTILLLPTKIASSSSSSTSSSSSSSATFDVFHVGAAMTGPATEEFEMSGVTARGLTISNINNTFIRNNNSNDATTSVSARIFDFVGAITQLGNFYISSLSIATVDLQTIQNHSMAIISSGETVISRIEIAIMKSSSFGVNSGSFAVNERLISQSCNIRSVNIGPSDRCSVDIVHLMMTEAFNYKRFEISDSNTRLINILPTSSVRMINMAHLLASSSISAPENTPERATFTFINNYFQSINVVVTPTHPTDHSSIIPLNLAGGALDNYRSIEFKNIDLSDVSIETRLSAAMTKQNFIETEFHVQLAKFGGRVLAGSNRTFDSLFSASACDVQNLVLRAPQAFVYGIVFEAEVSGFEKYDFRSLRLNQIDVETGNHSGFASEIAMVKVQDIVKSDYDSSSFNFEFCNILRVNLTRFESGQCSVSLLSLGNSGNIQNITGVVLRSIIIFRIDFSSGERNSANLVLSAFNQMRMELLQLPSSSSNAERLPSSVLVDRVTLSTVSAPTSALVTCVDFAVGDFIRGYETVTFSNLRILDSSLVAQQTGFEIIVSPIYARLRNSDGFVGPSSSSRVTSFSVSYITVDSITMSPYSSKVYCMITDKPISNFDTVHFSSLTVNNINFVDPNSEGQLNFVVEMVAVPTVTRSSSFSSSPSSSRNSFVASRFHMSNIDVGVFSSCHLSVSSGLSGYNTVELSDFTLENVSIVELPPGRAALLMELRLVRLRGAVVSSLPSSSSSSSPTFLVRDFAINNISVELITSAGGINVYNFYSSRNIEGYNSVVFSNLDQHDISIYSRGSMNVDVVNVRLDTSVFTTTAANNNNDNSVLVFENISSTNCELTSYINKLIAFDCSDCDLSNFSSTLINNVVMNHNAASRVSAVSSSHYNPVIRNRFARSLLITNCQIIENQRCSGSTTSFSSPTQSSILYMITATTLWSVTMIGNSVLSFGNCSGNTNNIFWAYTDSIASAASLYDDVQEPETYSFKIFNSTMSEVVSPSVSSVLYMALPSLLTNANNIMNTNNNNNANNRMAYADDTSSSSSNNTSSSTSPTVIFTVSMEYNEITNPDFKSYHIASFPSSSASPSSSLKNTTSRPKFVAGFNLECNTWARKLSVELSQILLRDFARLMIADVTCPTTATPSSSRSVSQSSTVSALSPSSSFSSALTPSSDRTLTKETATESAPTDSVSDTHDATLTGSREVSPPPFVSPYKSLIDALTFSSLVISQFAVTSSTAPMVRSIRTKSVLDIMSKDINGNCDASVLPQREMEEIVLETEPDITESPFALRFSNELGGYASGQVFGGLLWIVGCCIGFPVVGYVLFIRGYNIRYTAKRRKKSVYGLFPLFSEIAIESKSLHLVFFSLQMLLQPICSASATLFFVDSVSIFMKVLCALLAISLVAGVSAWCYGSLFKRNRTEEFIESDSVVPPKFQEELGLFSGERGDVDDEIEKLKEDIEELDEKMRNKIKKLLKNRNSSSSNNNNNNNNDDDDGDDSDDEEEEAKPFFLIRGINYLNEVNGEWKHLKIRKKPAARINNVTSFYFALPLLEGYSDNAPRFAIADFAAVFMMFLTSFVGEWFVGSCIFAGVSLIIVILIHLLLCLKLSPFADRISRVVNPLFCVMEIIILLITLFGNNGEDDEMMIVEMQLVLAVCQMLVSVIIGLGVLLFLFDGLVNLYNMRKKFELVEKIHLLKSEMKKREHKTKKLELKDKEKKKKKQKRGSRSPDNDDDESSGAEDLREIQRRYVARALEFSPIEEEMSEELVATTVLPKNNKRRRNRNVNLNNSNTVFSPANSKGILADALL